MYIEFNKHYMKSKIPFQLFFDFESTLKKIQSCENNKDKSYEVKTEKHESNSYAAYLDSTHNDIIESRFYNYVGEDASSHFVSFILDLMNQFSEIFHTKL